MSTSAKRRVSERSRSSVKKGYTKFFSVGKNGWLDELIALSCLGFGIFLFLSLVSYQINNGHLFEVNADQVFPLKNVMGVVGDLLASVLMNNMGWCAYVPVAWAGWLAWFYWQFDEDGRGPKFSARPTFFIGLVLLLACTAAFGALLGGREVGGTVGFQIANPLIRFFNFWGAFLCTLFGIFLSLAMVSRVGVGDLLSRTLRVTLILAAVVFMKIPQILLNTLLLGAHILFFSLGAIWRFVLRTAGADTEHSSEPDADAELAFVPKPRRRKNEIAAEPEIEEAQDSTPPEEVYSHVVVSRKKSDYTMKPSDGKSLKKRIEKLKEPEGPIQEYVRPDINYLTKSEETFVSENDDELIQTSKQIEAKLKDFNILGRVTEVHPGPVITLYEFEPAAGVKVGRISALQDDLAMSLKATSIRILAPIPNRGTVGIEVPNKHRELVRLRDVLESEAFVNAESILNIAIGKDTYGEPVVVDIASMPHLLMAGTTGTGKSVCINTILLSLLYRATPAELGLIMIDPKILELSVYEGIPHLKVPVVTNAKQAKAVLDWAVKEMDRRYRLMQKYGVRNIDGYNKVAKGELDVAVKSKPEDAKSVLQLSEDEEVRTGEVDVEDLTDLGPPARQPQQLIMAEKLEVLPKIVIVIDELADLMLAVGREVEESVTRLAQKARASGIHMIVATQRPSVDVITGLIKANFPARLSFRVSSRIDSRTILDSMGAEKLLGRGDMLFQVPGSPHLKRVHGAFVSDNEVKKVIGFLKKHTSPAYDAKIMKVCEEALEEETNGSSGEPGSMDNEYDAFYDKAVELVVAKGQASTSMIQRAFRIGYNRAARIIESMERDGVIGPMDGVKPRDVLLQSQESADDNF